MCLWAWEFMVAVKYTHAPQWDKLLVWWTLSMVKEAFICSPHTPPSRPHKLQPNYQAADPLSEQTAYSSPGIYPTHSFAAISLVCYWYITKINTKLKEGTGTLEDMIRIQNCLDRLEKLSETHRIKFNTDKCKSLSLEEIISRNTK